MNKLTILGAVLILFSACAMPQGGMKRKGGLLNNVKQPAQEASQYFVDETVEVITEPPGAKILVNDASVGYSPVKTVVRRMWRGDPKYPMTLDTVKIEALPVGSGQCVQAGVYGGNSGKTPPQVRFTMTSCSPQPTSGK